MDGASRQRQLQQAMANANLSQVCINLSSRSVKEAAHVMELSLPDCMHLGQATYAQAEATMLVAAKLLAPRCTSLLHRLDLEKAQPLTLGIPAVDTALGGGLLTASITELVGAAGTASS